MTNDDWKLFLEALGIDYSTSEFIKEREQLREKINVGFYGAELIVFRKHGFRAIMELVGRISELERKLDELENKIGVKDD